MTEKKQQKTPSGRGRPGSSPDPSGDGDGSVAVSVDPVIEDSEITEVKISAPGRDDGPASSIPSVLSILPLRDTVLYPEIVAPVMVGREPSKKLIDDALSGDKIIGVVALRDAFVEEPKAEDLYEVGTAARVVQMFKFPDGTMRIVVEGITRIRTKRIIQTYPFFRAEVEVVGAEEAPSAKVEALVRTVLGTFQRMVEIAPYIPDQLFAAAINISEPENLADFMASNANIDLRERQELLETVSVEERLEKLIRILNRELEILQMGTKIQEEVQSEMEQGQREFWLRKQMEAIRRELGEAGDEKAEVEELREQLAKLVMPDEARKEAERELARLERIPSASPEHAVIRTYLDWMIAFPWEIRTVDNIDVPKAADILDEDHHDLEKIKERILEYLAVRKLKNDMRGPILCFAGPPGVGKTSLGKSIARAVGRKFVRMSLGGVRDEAEIRGHRRTYIGAMPGRILQALRRAGTINPVVMLDEIDKLGADFRGDPAAALLEVLDPEQNNTFRDHYLDVPTDLSSVMFITTANVLETIPPALLDRMEVLQLPGYTDPDKLEIARRFLVPRQIREHGLSAAQLRITDAALTTVIQDYTREAGVRNLDREIATLARKAAKSIAAGQKRKVKIDSKEVRALLGQRKFRHTAAEESDEVGVATGLAVTGAGGDVLFVEASAIPGKGALTLTGQLGQVMQESARAALTYARSRSAQLEVEDDWWERYDIHIHVPAGAIPKDGPSAGITMAVAVVSVITGTPVRKSVGMTGEITLRGKVLPIGGLKEKVLAAHRAGLTTVAFPRENDGDLEDIPEFVRDELELIMVDTVDDVLGVAFGGRFAKVARGSRSRTAKTPAKTGRARKGTAKAPARAPARAPAKTGRARKGTAKVPAGAPKASKTAKPSRSAAPATRTAAVRKGKSTKAAAASRKGASAKKGASPRGAKSAASAKSSAGSARRAPSAKAAQAKRRATGRSKTRTR